MNWVHYNLINTNFQIFLVWIGVNVMEKKKKDLWDATLYDEKHRFVSSYGQDLIELLNPKQGENILDLGCGTGDLANDLHGLDVQVLGIDFSSNMIEQAKNKYPQVSFQVMDANALPFENEFDAVFSNATLHWIKTPQTVLESVYRSLKSGGRFVAEFGGKGNVQQITDELIQQIRKAGIDFSDENFPWYFPTVGQYTTLMESVGFQVGLAQHFARPTKLDGERGLRNWIEMFSPSFFEQIEKETKEKIIQNTVQNLKETLCQNHVWYADYKRIRVFAFKK